MKRTIALVLLCGSVSLACATTDTGADAASPAAVVASTFAPLSEPTIGDGWKKIQFPTSLLRVNADGVVDETLGAFYRRARKAFLNAVIKSNDPLDTSTSELEEYIKGMDQSLKLLGEPQTAIFSKTAQVTSSDDLRDSYVSLIDQYRGMSESFKNHLTLTCGLARTLLDAIEHEKSKITKSQEALKGALPEGAIKSTQEFIDRAQNDVAQLQGQLVAALSISYALYPLHPEGSPSSFMKAMRSWFPPSDLIAKELKSMCGVDKVPTQWEFTMPDPAINPAFSQYLQKMLGTESWVLSQALASERLVWTSPEGDAKPVTKEASSTTEVLSSVDTPALLDNAANASVEAPVIPPVEENKPTVSQPATGRKGKRLVL